MKISTEKDETYTLVTRVCHGMETQIIKLLQTDLPALAYSYNYIVLSVLIHSKHLRLNIWPHLVKPRRSCWSSHQRNRLDNLVDVQD